jgi:ribose transport system ATP-binding protein
VQGKNMDNILELDKINKSFPGVHALKNMSFSVKSGEVHAICGENGAGKSTLMKVISGVYKQDSGNIIFDGVNVKIKNPHEALELGISIMYQETSLFPEMTILENLFLNHELTKKICLIPVLDYPSMESKVNDVFESLNSSLNLHVKIKDIGMAQKQLVEIAKALTFNSRVLIMDEPTASLTQREVEALFEIIRSLKGRGVAIVYISHRLEEIFEVCDRVTVIRDGEYISCNNVADTNKDKLVSDMVGRTIGQYYPKVPVEIGDVVFEVKGLNQKNLLYNINMNIKQGEIVGLGGLAGSGRTELAHAICGFTRKDSGEIILNGRVVHIKNYRDAMEAGVVYVTEDRARYGLVVKMNIKQNVTLPQINKITKMFFINKAVENELGQNAIRLYDIKAPDAKFVVENLSGGNQQKVSVAKATELNPYLLILDEPTRGVDVNAKAEIHKLIGSLVQKGLSILMISSELPELLGMCDRIYVMTSGEIKGCFERNEATQELILKVALDNA